MVILLPPILLLLAVLVEKVYPKYFLDFYILRLKFRLYLYPEWFLEKVCDLIRTRSIWYLGSKPDLLSDEREFLTNLYTEYTSLKEDYKQCRVFLKEKRKDL